MLMGSTDRSKIGRNNRLRGKTTQREYARLNCAAWGVDPDTHAAWTQTEPDNLYRDCPGEGWYVSVKAEATWALRAYLKDAATRAGNRPFWVATRRPRATWQMYAHTWYAVVPEPFYLTTATGETIFEDPETLNRVRLAAAEQTPGLLRDCYGYPAPKRWLTHEWVLAMEAIAAGAPWTILLEDTISVPNVGPFFMLMPYDLWATTLKRAWDEKRGT